MNVHHTAQTISWFKDRRNEKALVFKPPFQRNPVWLPKHKAYLIDTVLHQLPIPEVYIQRETDEDGQTIYSIIDGQQRIRSLLEFADGEVELMEEYSPNREGQNWDDLSKDEKKRFWNYSIVVREVLDATDNDLRDLFQRLNQSTVVLNAQEIRNAKWKGDFIGTMTEIADNDYWADSGIVKVREIRRMLDIEFISELFIGVMHGTQNKKDSLDKFYELYEGEIPNKQKWVSLFESTRMNISRALPNIRETRFCQKSDFYSLFLAMYNTFKGFEAPNPEKIGKKLTEFGKKVTRGMGKDPEKISDGNVISYIKAVEKAASDKSRRSSRIDTIQIVIGA